MFFSRADSNRQRFVSRQKFVPNFGRNRFVNDYAPRGRAALSRRADGAEKDRLRGHVDIGAGRDNERVIATKLHDGSPQSAMDRFRTFKPMSTEPVADTNGCGDHRQFFGQPSFDRRSIK